MCVVCVTEREGRRKQSTKGPRERDEGGRKDDDQGCANEVAVGRGGVVDWWESAIPLVGWMQGEVEQMARRWRCKAGARRVEEKREGERNRV